MYRGTQGYASVQTHLQSLRQVTWPARTTAPRVRTYLPTELYLSLRRFSVIYGPSYLDSRHPSLTPLVVAQVLCYPDANHYEFDLARRTDTHAQSH